MQVNMIFTQLMQLCIIAHISALFLCTLKNGVSPLGNEEIIARIKKLCQAHGVSVNKAEIESGAGKSIVSGLRRGSIPSASRLGALAAYLDTSVDYLLGNTEDEAPQPKEIDCSDHLEKLLSELEEKHEGLMFDGQPMDDETRRLLAISLRNSMDLARKMAKEKYTPKKYRKEDK